MQPQSHPHPHSSTSSHLATETALLTVLYDRSKAQHRSQIFLSRLQGVLRLSKRVIAALPRRDGSSSQVDPYAEVLGLLPKFISNLLRAAAASTAIIDLNHFVPLHTTLLACYARLLSVSLALGSALGVPQANLLSESRAKPIRRKAGVMESPAKAGEVKAGEVTVGEVTVGEVGEIVARSVASTTTVSVDPAPESHPDQDRTEAQGILKKRRAKGMDEIGAKQKNKDGGIDAIFGNRNNVKEGMDDIFQKSSKKARTKDDGIDDIFDTKPKKKKRTEAPAPDTDVTPASATASPKSKPEKPNKAKSDAMGISKSKSKKTKKKSTMDDIFGF
ncbi:hypothetical protein CcaverHIS002_0304360 [Cutaneotrichosporon cavernicola]|nr:hypothetical protein CcaverHIS002_0304360 [Cutaneotrichosporon cavernicola]